MFAVQRLKTFHSALWGAGMAQCGPGSIPRSGVICGLSLLVLYSAPRGPQKLKFDLI